MDEEWIIREIRHYIDHHPEPFNAVSIDDNGNVTVEFKDDVGRGIAGMVEYRGSLPTTNLNTIWRRGYLSVGLTHVNGTVGHARTSA
jgi:hypothetical protein